MTISQGLIPGLAFCGFGNGLLRRLKPNLRVGAVAKRLFRGCTATTKRHSVFQRGMHFRPRPSVQPVQ